jgi:amino-acid N-acetyltransferase
MLPPTIRSARRADRSAVLDLLEQAGLPQVGVREALAGFLVAESRGRIVGCIGLEGQGRSRLLRSAAVAPRHRGRGVGQSLVRALLAMARKESCRSLFLLTTTAAAFFERFGFLRASRQDVPRNVRRYAEFRGACPESAVLMRLNL